MATYEELAKLKQDNGTEYDVFRLKIKVAIAKKAQVIIDDGASTAPQDAWAMDALKNVASYADEILNYVVAKNDTATISQILNAADGTIQTNVDAAVDNLYGK